ncbi:hypothetical protein KPL76_07655 [Subtercola sp. PAMC28395]|uniref:hypothetical protein n=1 Tax=Subtercola sp. PAMC28395 TaxID=2846775 RepID=UPI001C0AF513|nr:hypothetical protein [Subtercola sp. PAMC28395]QWT22689.1 hypothetical protein KPL76_07655 [Subtercola sp. PAMC28395]
MAETDAKIVAAGAAIILQTQKRDGSWVATPVTPTLTGERILLLTAANSGKAKRIRNFPGVKVAAGTNSGKTTGPERLATARRLEGPDAEAGLSLIRKKHPVVFGVIIRMRYKITKLEPAVFELSDIRAAA